MLWLSRIARVAPITPDRSRHLRSLASGSAALCTRGAVPTSRPGSGFTEELAPAGLRRVMSIAADSMREVPGGRLGLCSRGARASTQRPWRCRGFERGRERRHSRIRLPSSWSRDDAIHRSDCARRRSFRDLGTRTSGVRMPLQHFVARGRTRGARRGVPCPVAGLRAAHTRGDRCEITMSHPRHIVSTTWSPIPRTLLMSLRSSGARHHTGKQQEDPRK